MRLFLLFSFTFLVAFSNDLKNISSYEANFVQTIVNSSKKEITYKGKIYVQEPSMILWKYLEPIEKNVYISKSIVTIIEPELEQVIISKLQKELNLLKLLKDAKKISKNSYISTVYDNEYKLTIKDNKLKKVSFKDDIENNITIVFSDIEQNKFLSKDIFKFKIPLDYDIIRK